MKLEGSGSQCSRPHVGATSRRSDTSGSQSTARQGSLAANRLVYVAAETGARFVRERIEIEPIDWLHRPCQLFDGKSAMDACRHAIGFERAIALHGLSLGLDTSPAVVSGVPITAFLSDHAMNYFAASPPRRREEPARKDRGAPALYSCIISAELDRGHIHVFGAMIARSASEVRFRIRQRFGPLLEDQAIVRLGFDWSEPLACAMVSQAMAHLLMLVAEDPTSSLAEGLDFQVEQRFAS
ncbi:conserved protein of unknown function [uncultured Sphingopyxis sp.]|uniref:Uncharacterized protein n=1 Tax=uncultured Sphingopyxis sp. TaxID=310581 RepID=A0A1Y5PMA5_9SPHN|nr:conserved protein of unknown function [uncultured Sphingopyxis sp.]